MNMYHNYILFLKTKDEIYLTKIITEIRPRLFGIIQSLPDYEWDDALQEIEIEMFLQLQQRKFVVPNLTHFFDRFLQSLSQANSEAELLKLLNTKTLNSFLCHTSFVSDAYRAYKEGVFDFRRFRETFISSYGDARIYRYIEKIGQTRRSIIFKRLNYEKRYIDYNSDAQNMVQIEEQYTEGDQNKITIYLNDLTKEEYEFIKYFIGKKCLRSQKFVGRILGISQQAVSRRLRTIKVNVALRRCQKENDKE